MPRVWVVQEGYYSDQKIVGVYTSELMADKIESLYPEERHTHAWDLDDMSEYNGVPHGMLAYMVVLLYDGTVDCVRQETPLEFNPGESQVEELEQWLCDIQGPRGKTARAHIACWALDKQHAIKIARDKLIDWKFLADLASSVGGL